MGQLDYKKIRVENDITLEEVANELLMSTSQYLLHEQGKRSYKGEYKQKCFDEDFLMVIEKKRRMKEKYDIDSDGLLWNKVTPIVVEEASKLYNEGKNVIQIAVKLGVDEIVLENQLRLNGILM